MPLVFRARTRAGWVAAAAVTLLFGISATWVLIWSPAQATISIPVTAFLAWGYLWLGIGALDVARCRTARLDIGPDRLVIVHDGLLRAPIVIERATVEAVTLDRRTPEERRVAAAVRRGGVAAATFLDARIPVVSAASSSHSPYGTAVVPNMVVLLREPVRAPKVVLAARVLLRVAQGKAGRYQGPKTGREMTGVRLAVADPEVVAGALGSWGVLAALPRDARYLAPITETHRSKARRNRRVLVVGVAAIAAFFVGLEILSRR